MDRVFLEVIRKPFFWMPACAGMTGKVSRIVIPAEAGIQAPDSEKVFG